MELTDQQWELFDFVKQHHYNQQRKYTGEPYFAHLLRVVQILSRYPLTNFELEIGLCHDLVERTLCTKQELILKLKEIGYDLFPRNKIAKGVSDMTDIYTEQFYPQLSRAERKEKEAERLLESEFFSQNVKYAELIDNIPSITKHDPDFVWVYLNEVANYIGDLNEGDIELYAECRNVLDTAIASI